MLIAAAVVVSSTGAQAQTQAPPRNAANNAAHHKTRAVRPPSKACAEFGAGFVQVAGTTTCVKIGGSVRVEGGYNVDR